MHENINFQKSDVSMLISNKVNFITKQSLEAKRINTPVIYNRSKYVHNKQQRFKYIKHKLKKPKRYTRIIIRAFSKPDRITEQKISKTEKQELEKVQKTQKKFSKMPDKDLKRQFTPQIIKVVQIKMNCQHTTIKMKPKYQIYQNIAKRKISSNIKCWCRCRETAAFYIGNEDAER